MKIRTGFVSNSSSSSFILITTKENHDKSFQKLDNLSKKIVSTIINPSQKFCGRDIISAEISSGDDYCTFEYAAGRLNMSNTSDIEIVEQAWEKYEKLLSENKEEVITYKVDL